MATDTADPGFGIYVHWPFCKAKCPYCDFNSHVAEAAIDQAAWRAALVAELRYAARHEAPGRHVTSIFFGGGTPSLMPPATVAAVLDTIAAEWSVASDVEITLEANPTSVEAAAFAELRRAGVNRLSVGVQSLRDDGLTFLGRQHDVATAKEAVATAAATFPRYSLDLIYARPGQDVAAWSAELAEGLALAGDHLALYQLTVEPGTRFAQAWGRGDLAMPDEDTIADLYEATQAITARAGLPAYEISNHATPGGACRHNLLYWLYGDYVGIGPGAHGRLSRDGAKDAVRRHRAPEIWRQRVTAQGHGTAASTPLAQDDRLAEMLMMGLRTTRGLPRARIRAELGTDPEALLPGEALRDLQEAGYITLDTDGLRATEAGRQRLNGVVTHLLPEPA